MTQKIINEILFRQVARRSPLPKEREHVKERLRDTRNARCVLLKCVEVPGREGEQICHLLALLLRENRGAVRIGGRLNGQMKPQSLLRVRMDRGISCWHLLPPTAS